VHLHSAVWKQPDILQTLRRDYAADFLAKPFQVEDLAALVLRMLENAATETETETKVE